MDAGTAPMPEERTPRSWIRGSRLGNASVSLRLGVLLAAATAATWPTLASLESYWREVRDYRHGYLVLLLVAGWLLASRRRFDRLPDAPTLAALGPLAVALIAWLVAVRGESLMLSQLLWPVILALVAWAGCGAAVARAVLPALAYLYFATPLWDHLVPILQWLTVVASEQMLSLAQIPFAIDGNFITVRDGTFEVAEGCAGKRYFVVTLAVAMALGVVERFPPSRLFAFMLFAASLAILTNWIRVVAIIVIGHATAMQHYFVAVEHESFGWMLFGPLLAAVIWAGHLWRPGARSAASLTVRPGRTSSLGGGWWPLPLLAAMWGWQALGGDPRPLAPRLGELPIQTGDWQGPFPPAEAWLPEYVGPETEVRAAYFGPDRRVEVYANVYGNQAPGRELVGYANSVIGPEWRVIEAPSALAGALVPLADRPRYLVAGPNRSQAWVVGRILRIGGTSTTSDLVAQALYGAHALARPVPAGAVAIAARCDGDCEGARAALAAFWNAAGPGLLEMIPEKAVADCSKLSVGQRVGEKC